MSDYNKTNKRPPVKLLALDLDGTLLDSSSRIPECHRQAVRRAQRAGVQIALCSGRSRMDAALFSAQLEAPADWLITCNGADVRQPDRPPVYTAHMDPALFVRLLDCGAARGADPCLYTPERIYYGPAFERFVDAIAQDSCILEYKSRSDYHFVPSRAAWDDVLTREGGNLCKTILYHDDPAVLDEILGGLQAEGGYEMAPSTMFGGRVTNVEINRAGVDKGRALTGLAERLGLRAEHIMAIGDSDNDLPMLRAAGLSVVMGGAPDYMRQAADFVTAGNEENGVGLAVDRFILGRT